jgi:hypothetical protein
MDHRCHSDAAVDRSLTCSAPMPAAIAGRLRDPPGGQVPERLWALHVGFGGSGPSGPRRCDPAPKPRKHAPSAPSSLASGLDYPLYFIEYNEYALKLSQ